MQEGKTKTAIARQIGVHPSTVSREIERNGTRGGRYRWREADEQARYRRERLPGNRATPGPVIDRALSLLREEQWSPEQISGYMEVHEGVSISPERIYKEIRRDRAEGGELWRHCRHKMRYRHHVRPRRPTKATHIPNRVSIHARPPLADGKRFGDWEMDFIVGKGHRSRILTLCERSTNYLIMRRVTTLRPEEVADEIFYALLPYKHSVLTITTDNGLEFRGHERVTERLGPTVYFADAYSSWQKGAIENANKLIRQYLPKGTDFNALSDAQIDAVQRKINRRPRKKLHFSNPTHEFFRKL